eukprot:TRINITY_DN10825_c0_g1_i1.p1 TRINITY_DN10825_c0_g1~~TRINITY_DN10825_c0_g1_i1.p1  ORF type:complete len:137 (+),score=19.09 TRINITY_DN10825_c0_g1_i1:32-442(+)
MPIFLNHPADPFITLAISLLSLILIYKTNKKLSSSFVTKHSTRYIIFSILFILLNTYFYRETDDATIKDNWKTLLLIISIHGMFWVLDPKEIVDNVSKRRGKRHEGTMIISMFVFTLVWGGMIFKSFFGEVPDGRY